MLNLSALNPEELIHEEGQTLIQQKLDAWLAEQHRIALIEEQRGDIPRSARSELDPIAQPYQDLIDRLFYLMAGLNESQSRGLEERLGQML